MKHLKLISCISLWIFAAHCSMAQNTDSIPAIDSISSYTSLHYKGSVTINMDNQTYNGQFNLVNVIDSFLYIQLNSFIEVGRVLLTPDQFLLVNKLQKNYYEGDYSIFQHLIDVDIDFYTLQAIFNGFPVDVPDGVALSYEGEPDSFFNKLLFESTDYELNLQLEVKKVTFNDAPKVSISVPRNFTAIKFLEED